MTSQQILQSDLLDILFEKRNKDYGAYTLRRAYQSEMIKALSISVVAIFSLMLFLTSSSSSETKVGDGPEVIVSTVAVPKALPKPEEPKLQQQKAAAPQVKQITYVTPVIVTKEPITPVPALTQINDAQVSNVTTDGKNFIPGSLVDPVGPPGGGTSPSTTVPELPKEVKPDRQPQFPGGSQAWLAFLNRHLRPPQELEAGDKRIVNIRFFVDVDGTITNFQVVKSGGNEFDEEVIRVLKKMPRWTPAMQAGQPVAISFTQPVTFVAAE